MTEPVFVHNISSLQLPKLVEKTGRGLDDLMPDEVGKIPGEVVDQPRVQNWIDQGRLKIISEEEFYKHFDSEPEKSSHSDNISFKAKHKVETDDQTTSVVPGVDELPEIDEIPEPDVENLDGAITVKAPENDEPLTERVGDEKQIDKKDLRPLKLEEDGTLTEMDKSKTLPAEKIEKPVAKPPVDFKDRDVSETQQVVEGEEPGQEEITTKQSSTEPLVESLAKEGAEEASSTEAEAGVVGEIVGMRAWRNQVKAIKTLKNVETILSIAEQSHRKVVKRTCAERIEELT